MSFKNTSCSRRTNLRETLISLRQRGCPSRNFAKKPLVQCISEPIKNNSQSPFQMPDTERKINNNNKKKETKQANKIANLKAVISLFLSCLFGLKMI